MTKNKIKSVVKLSLIVGTIVSMFFVPWILVKAWLLPLPNTVQEQLQEATEHGFDGIVVYIDQAGQKPLFYSAGWHNREKKIPANPNAYFKIGSISKLYTAVAITKLVARNVLSLDKTLTDYIPKRVERIANANKITLRMLVQHRSGLPNYTDTPEYWANPKESAQDKLDLIYGLPSQFEPNTDYEYCNTNYLLLSEIMNKILGYPYFQCIQVEILNRLDLKNTFQSIEDVDINNVMSGYHVGHPFDLKTDNQGMVATAEDVGLFLRALIKGNVFDDGEKELYTSLYEYEHKGWVPGYQSIAKYHKNIDAVVVQFTSTTDPKLYNWNLADIVHGRVVKIQSTTE